MEKDPRRGTNFHPLRNESVSLRNKAPFGSSASITIKFPWNWITNFPLEFLLPLPLPWSTNRRKENRRKMHPKELNYRRTSTTSSIITIPSDFSRNRFEKDDSALSPFHPSRGWIPERYFFASHSLIPTLPAVDVFHFANPYLEFHRFLPASRGIESNSNYSKKEYAPICLLGWSYSCVVYVYS